MQKMRVVVVTVVVILSTGFCVLIIVSLIPYFSVIGRAATVVVIVLLACIATLMLSFTWSRIGVWSHRRHLLIAGDVVVYLDDSGKLLHLSAMHEQAKLPAPQQVTVKELPAPKEPTVDKETVLELYSHGNTLRTIAETTGLSYYQVQKITSGKD